MNKEDIMFYFDFPIYPNKIVCCFGDYNNFNEMLKKKFHFNENDVDIKLNNSGKAILFNSGNILIWLRNKPKDIIDLAILNHEIFHCTHMILDYAGVLYTDQSAESFAYVMEYLTNKIYKKLKLSFYYKDKNIKNNGQKKQQRFFK